MEKEKINVAEILRNCQSGMELDCVCFENVVFDRVDDKNRIRCFVGSQRDEVSFNEYGCLNGSPSAKCVIFPESKTSWEGFVPPCKYEDGDILAYKPDPNVITIYVYRKHSAFNTSYYVALSELNGFMINNHVDGALNAYNKTARFATQSEKQKLFDAIKANGCRWNEETKTLEKLVPDKFNINTLVPFESKVLVRNSKTSIWKPAIWGCYTGETYGCCVLGGICWLYCIPYEGNQHLIGKTDDCDEYFKTWSK